jgi:hypothetical protein
LIAATLMLATSALVQSATPPSYGIETGNSFLKMCGNPDAKCCTAYVTAIVDVMARNTINGFHACIPEAVTARQAVNVAMA